MLLQHKGAFQELFESAQDLQTVPTNLFSRRLYGACMSGVRLEDRAVLRLGGLGPPSATARYCLVGRLVGREGIVAHVCAITKESISRGETDFTQGRSFLLEADANHFPPGKLISPEETDFPKRFPAGNIFGEHASIIFPRGT